MHPVKHIFFDLDHTLWDFDANSHATIKALFYDKKLDEKLDCDVDEFYHAYIRINEQKWELYRQHLITKDRLRAERFVETFAEFGFHDSELAMSYENEYLNTCPYKSILIEGTLETLDYLNDKYDLCIITNGFFETQKIKLRESGLTPYFNHVFTSDQIGCNKPDRRIFHESLKQSGAQRKSSVMIGDSLVTDILGAKNYGMAQVFFNPDGQMHSERITHEIKKLEQLRDLF